MKQILREAEVNENLRLPVNDVAVLLLAVVEGSITRFVRSEFKSSPVAGWERQWELIRKSVFS
ncbi:MAG: hypothetical protein HY082_10150 [Gammaproteobacteria bacterium]|nr:hypothetical protein [Gammaproteobacteria bacterium]